MSLLVAKYKLTEALNAYFEYRKCSTAERKTTMDFNFYNKLVPNFDQTLEFIYMPKN